MANSNFSTGEKVRLNGRKGLYRFVHKNVVREISTGQLISVPYNRIRKDSNWLRDLGGLIKAFFA